MVSTDKRFLRYMSIVLLRIFWRRTKIQKMLED